MAKNDKFSVTWLHTTPSPYQMEFWEALSRSGHVHLRALNCAQTSSYRPWRLREAKSFSHLILPGVDLAVGRSHRELHINPGIVREVLKSPKDEIWIVSSYAIPTMQIAMYLLSLRGIRWILCNEAPKRNGILRRAVRNCLLFPVKKYAVGVIVFGSEKAATYYERLHEASKVFSMPQYEDISRYLTISRQGRIARLRKREICYFYAGQLETFSGVDLLIRCFNRLASRYSRIRLDILGDGSQRRYLESLVSEPAKSRVKFHGAVDWDLVSQFYSCGDVFVHPSHGQGWGMVVNEALAAGMPVITSQAVRAAEELIVDGVSGFLLRNPRDESGFYEKMGIFIRSPELIDEFGREARRTALQHLTLEKGVERFINILTNLLSL